MEFKKNNVITWYEDLAITAKGSKFAGSQMGECTVTIANLSRENRHELLSKSKTGKSARIFLEVGRESTGTNLIFSGDIYRVFASQPPDITLEFKCLAGNSGKSRFVSRSNDSITSLKNITQTLAKENNWRLSFEIADKNIGSYSYTGDALSEIKEIDKLAIGVDVFEDNEVLYVKYSNAPIAGSFRKVLNKSSGMIGSPTVTEVGLSVTMLYDSTVKVGSSIKIESELNPSINGIYLIYKLSFSISNRSTEFYLMAECNKNG